MHRDIEGLRALAVLLVVTYHVWLGRVSGGVDVFLFLSALLLTGGIVRRLERGERVNLPRQWLKVFKRLLPAAAVVVASTVAAGLLLLPQTRWRGLLVDATGSMGYVENWVLAQRSVDYYAADKGSASPLQHMWSLSLQGQVFLVWPVLLVLLAVLARRTGRLSLRVALWGGLGTVALVSFVYSVHATATHRAFAYFDGGARLWEFALGGLLALAVTRVRLPSAVAAPLGWVGVLGLLTCGAVLDVTRSFPGWAALWPLISAAAVVLAGTATVRWGVGRVLGTRPLVALGGISYALYLVHWPLLVLWLATSGKPRAGILDGAALVAVSLVLAWALSRAVEPRSAHCRGCRSHRGAPRYWCWAPPAWSSASPGWASPVWTPAPNEVQGCPRGRSSPATQGRGRCPAARPWPRCGWKTGCPPPPPCAPSSHLCRRGAPAAGPMPGSARPCTQLDPPGGATTTVVVVGDSHAEQWLATLQPLAEQNHWRLVALLKGACSFGDPSARTGDCADFNTRAEQYLDSHPIDLLVTVSTAAHKTTPRERLVEGYEDSVRTMTSHGIPVVGLRDNPRFSTGVVACVLERGDHACTSPAAHKLAATNPADALAGIPGFTSIDLTDLVCPDGQCVPSVGNVWVYLDDNHLTRSYAATLAPELAQRLRAAGAWPGTTTAVVAGHASPLRC